MSACFGAKNFEFFEEGEGVKPVQTFFRQGCQFLGDICVFIVI